MSIGFHPPSGWIGHYAEHGYAVFKRVVGPPFLAAALGEVRRLIGSDAPLAEWTQATAPRQALTEMIAMPVLAGVYDQPGIRAILEAMFAPTGRWSGERAFQLFVKPFDPHAAAALPDHGHIDFKRCLVPIFGSGFIFQVALSDTDPFGGNIALWPGSHRLVQKLIMENPGWRYPRDRGTIPLGRPFEFVAEAGDVLVINHLMVHEGSSNHGARRAPRITLHCQGLRDRWLARIDPAQRGLSPWERALAMNGPFRLPYDEEAILLGRGSVRDLALVGTG